MKALISTTESVNHIVSWELNPNWDGIELRYKYFPVYETLSNAKRICEVSENEFPVAEPLFWVDCSNDVRADVYYYDTVNKTINPVVNAPLPETE